MKRSPKWTRWVASVGLGAALGFLSGCTEPPAAPPVTVGELTLSRSQLVPERYTLHIAIFNTGASQLHRYRISARAAVAGQSEGERLPIPVAFVIDQSLEARARTVHAMTFDSPLSVTPREGLALQEITFHDFHFATGRRPGTIEYGYSVEEVR